MKVYPIFFLLFMFSFSLNVSATQLRIKISNNLASDITFAYSPLLRSNVKKVKQLKLLDFLQDEYNLIKRLKWLTIRSHSSTHIVINTGISSDQYILPYLVRTSNGDGHVGFLHRVTDYSIIKFEGGEIEFKDSRISPPKVTNYRILKDTNIAITDKEGVQKTFNDFFELIKLYDHFNDKKMAKKQMMLLKSFARFSNIHVSEYKDMFSNFKNKEKDIPKDDDLVAILKDILPIISNDINGYAESRYGKKGLLVLKKLKDLGGNFSDLIVDSGIVYSANQFVTFVRENNYQELDAWSARDYYSQYLGYEYVYRGIALTKEQVLSIKKEGLKSNLLRNNNFAREFLFRSQQDEIETHKSMDQNFNNLISVTKDPIIAEGFANYSANLDLDIYPYVFLLKVPKLNLLEVCAQSLYVEQVVNYIIPGSEIIDVMRIDKKSKIPLFNYPLQQDYFGGVYTHLVRLLFPKTYIDVRSFRKGLFN